MHPLNRIAQSSNTKRLLNAVLLICVTLLLAGSLAYALRLQLLTSLASFLIVNDHLQPADIVFVLTGDVYTRPLHASELFKQGLAPRIVIPRGEDTPAVELGLFPNATDVAVGVMKELGVPNENITVLSVVGGSTSTHDDAVILRQYVEDHAIERVILVTSAFHTRRTAWAFKKEFSDSSATLEIAAAPHREFDETNWWKTERGLITLANEYIKLVYYFVTYR